MTYDELATLYARILSYYSERVQRYGSTPRGVDWTCIASQDLRFLQLMKLCDFSAPFSLNDIGCGYGALVGYLLKRHATAEIDYLGVDLAPTMVRRARSLWRSQDWASFVVAQASPRPADYCIASGIFNVKLQESTLRWERFVARSLTDMYMASHRGFAANFMLAKSARRNARSGLYQSRPEKWSRHCEREYGSSVTILDGYGQQEFTLLVRRKDLHPST